MPKLTKEDVAEFQRLAEMDGVEPTEEEAKKTGVGIKTVQKSVEGERYRSDGSEEGPPGLPVTMRFLESNPFRAHRRPGSSPVIGA